MNLKHEMPIYMRIAVDLAGRIHKGEFEKQPKLKGRSSLASDYNVSPETIRRAIRILEDTNIVRVVHGSGIFIESYENVEMFIERFKIKETILDYKDKLSALMNEKVRIDNEINQIIQDIVDYSIRLKNSDQILPQEIQLSDQSHFIGKCVQELGVWQSTGVTIVGIRRKDELIISPGPYAKFQHDDRIVVVGSVDSIKRFIDYMNFTE